VFGREDLLARENLSTNSQRIDASEWLLPELELFFGDMTKTEIILKCDEAEIPFSPISHPEDLFDDPQLNEADSLVEVTLEDGRKTKLPRLPILIEGDDLGLRMEAPKIGEHTQNLLHDIGYTDDAIQRLVDTKVIVTDGDFD
jgi:crotonobetainyl-CoA:carnitine CoA-transferase CaiB-like acyl-CoA transferase